MNDFLCFLKQIFAETWFQIVFSGIGGTLLGAIVGILTSQHIENKKYRSKREKNSNSIKSDIQDNLKSIPHLQKMISDENKLLEKNKLQITPFFKFRKPNWEIFFTTPPEQESEISRLREIFHMTEDINTIIESRENYRINNRGSNNTCSSMLEYNRQLTYYLVAYQAKLKKG